MAETLVGYRADVDLPAAWRRGALAVWLAAVLIVAVMTFRAVHNPPAHTRGHIEISARLDDFTRSAGDRTRNTIPAFLSRPGLLGAIAPGVDPGQVVRPVNEGELRHGFCSPSLARVVRYEYPNISARMSDASVEKLAIARRPEYADRLCSLPVFVEADPSEIVKYTVRPRSLASRAARTTGALLVTALFGLAALNVYFRGILGWAAPA